MNKDENRNIFSLNIHGNITLNETCHVEKTLHNLRFNFSCKNINKTFQIFNCKFFFNCRIDEKLPTFSEECQTKLNGCPSCDIVILRAPVCKNQTYHDKGGKFDFFHILMFDGLEIWLKSLYSFFSVKYPFISKKNAKNPLKSSFEALNHYTDLRASRAKTNYSTAFKTLKSFLTISKYQLEWFFGKYCVVLCIRNNLNSKA